MKTEWHCFMFGHEKEWDRGFFGPTWKCRQCGKEGDLQAHSKMSGFEWLTIIVPTILVAGIVLFLVRDYL